VTSTATDKPRRFSQPYSSREALGLLIKNLTGPRLGGPPLPSLPRDGRLNRIERRLRLGFVGDLLPLRDKHLTMSPCLQRFFHGVDVLIGNFEGVLTDGREPRVFMGQAHDGRVLALLRALAPPHRTVLCCANNHGADFGTARYHTSMERLEALGYRTIGSAERPTLQLDHGVTLGAGTDWSNQPTDQISTLEPLGNQTPHGPFSILCPHWGYELETTPRAEQWYRASDWLSRWDLVVGHHSHTPQPMTAAAGRAGPTAVGYSLGNFTFGYDLAYHRHGLVLRVDIGPDAGGRWQVGALAWRRVMLRFHGKRGSIELAG
jgi:hypothetical protein